MSIWISWIIAGAISMYAYYYEYKRMFEKKHSFRSSEILTFILLVIFNSVMINMFTSSIRIIFTFVSIVILLKVCFKDKLEKNIIFAIISCIIMALSEMIFVAICVLGLGIQDFASSWWIIIISNIGISIIFLTILSIQKIQRIMHQVIKWYEGKHLLNLIVVIVLYMITINVILYQNSTGSVSQEVNFIINDIFLICIITFMVVNFNEKSTNSELTQKYDVLLDYAKTYEQEVVEKSKWQHEYENQLIIVKDKISARNKEAREYIDKLLKNKPVDNNSEWLKRLSKFPDIGIKGLLCYKIGQMQAKGINVFIDISENLKIKKVHKDILKDNLQDISRALGVYIDNAIEAAEQADSKYFIFQFTCTENNLIFEISNTFSGNLDLQKIGTEGFSTKGKGHGYGLSLVKDILEKNQLISEEREINGMYYVQKLMINIKK